MPTTSIGVEAPAEIVSPPAHFLWEGLPDGSQLSVTGMPAQWQKLHYSDGEDVNTVTVGVMSRPEARATRSIRDGSWQIIDYGPLIIAVKVER